MAVRLPVILAQSSSRSAKQTQAEEDWIAHLLFEARLDATLIADLPTIALESTDQLCLEGIKGDFVLLSWLDPQVCSQHLGRLLDVPVQLIPLAGDEPAEHQAHDSRNIGLQGNRSLGGNGAKPKKVYFLRLDVQGDSREGKQSVSRLLQSLSTPVFQLGVSKAKVTTLPVQRIDGTTRSAAAINSSQIPVDVRDSTPGFDDLSAVDSLVDELNSLDI